MALAAWYLKRLVYALIYYMFISGGMGEYRGNL